MFNSKLECFVWISGVGPVVVIALSIGLTLCFGDNQHKDFSLNKCRDINNKKGLTKEAKVTSLHIQSSTSWNSIWKQTKIAARNISILAIPTAIYLEYFVCDKSCTNWSWLKWFIIFILNMFMSDFLLYLSHRFIWHNKILYPIIHKLHHTYKFPSSITTFYVSISESIGTWTSISITSCIFNLPMSILFIWYYIFFIFTHLEHGGGYYIINFINKKILPFEILMDQHNIHHNMFYYNYGSMFNIWDKMFGTYFYQN